MDGDSSTCWTVVRGASAGRTQDREEFARRYEPLIRAYLKARWGANPLGREIDDAVQEVFIECFRQGGALGRADPGRPGGFRPFLHGVVRNVALMTERRRARDRVRPADEVLAQLPANEDSLATVFERAWAMALLKEAGARHGDVAAQKGEAALKRRELLRLRFEEAMPIRDIARRWGADPARLHHDYAVAREEFRAALHEVVSFHHPGDADEIDRECRRLLAVLS